MKTSRIILWAAILAMTVMAHAAQAGPPAAAAGAPAAGTPGASSMPAPPAPSVPHARIMNEKPMGPMTQYFIRKDFLLAGGDPNKPESLAYFWRAPPKVDDGKKYPLVVVLHDEKGEAPGAEYLLTSAMLQYYPSYIVVPALAARKQWAFPDEIEDKVLQQNLGIKQTLPDVVDLVKSLQSENPAIDADRTYIVGCSMGGWGVFGAALHDNDVFAAGIEINGGWNVKDAPKLNHMPMIVEHGLDNKRYKAGDAQDVAFWIQKNLGSKHQGDIAFYPWPNVGQECDASQFYQVGFWKWLFAKHK